MLDAWLSVVDRVDVTWFLVSAACFVSGYVAAYPVARFDVEVLTWYPLWVWRKVKEAIDPDDPWLKLFVFLFTFNSVSLLANFLSGFLVVLPLVFAVLLGLNIGVIAMEEAGGWGLFAMTALNPVAWIELPAAWTSLAIGFQLAETLLERGVGAAAAEFPALAEVYLYVVLPLLLAAALLESTLIWVLPSDAGTPLPKETAADVEGDVDLQPADGKESRWEDDRWEEDEEGGFRE